MQLADNSEVIFMIDSNVLLSGLYYSSKKDTSPHKIIELIKLIVKRKIFTPLKLFFPKIQLYELIEVIRRKINDPYDRLLLEEFFRLLYDISDDVSQQELLKAKQNIEKILNEKCLNGKHAACNFDQDDIYLISAALSINAKYFVTGDKNIHNAFCRKNKKPACIEELIILYPSEFIEYIKKEVFF